MAVIAEQLRRFRSAIPFLGKETSQRPPFDERWQNAPYNPSEIDGGSFVRKEISDLISRMRKNRAHTEVILPNRTGGFEKKMYRMDVPDLAQRPLDEGLKTPLLAHLADRQANSQYWGGEPAVGISVFTDRHMGYGTVGVELMVGTVDAKGGTKWVDGRRQGVSARVGNIVLAIADWDWIPAEIPDGPNLEQMLDYVRANPPFQVAKELCRFAEYMIETPKLPAGN